MQKILTFFLFLMSISLTNAQEDYKVNIELNFVDNSYDGYQEFSKKTIFYLEKVLNSDTFRTELLKLKMCKKQGKTNLQIFDLILNGYEKQCLGRIISKAIPNRKCPKRTIDFKYKCPENGIRKINLKVRTINICDGKKWLNENCKLDSRSRTIGIDGNGDGVTAICPQRLKKWFDSKKTNALAGHYMHEYMHIIGFSHRGLWKYKSAVYQIGYLVRDLVKYEMSKDK